MRRSGSRPVSGSGDGSVSPPMSCAYVWQQIVIVVNKDEKGYGMKVSGDNPVYVQSVKDGEYYSIFVVKLRGSSQLLCGHYSITNSLFINSISFELLSTSRV